MKAQMISSEKDSWWSYVPLFFPKGSSYFTPTQWPGLKSVVPVTRQYNVQTILISRKTYLLKVIKDSKRVCYLIKYVINSSYMMLKHNWPLNFNEMF